MDGDVGVSTIEGTAKEWLNVVAEEHAAVPATLADTHSGRDGRHGARLVIAQEQGGRVCILPVKEPVHTQHGPVVKCTLQ